MQIKKWMMLSLLALVGGGCTECPDGEYGQQRINVTIGTLPKLDVETRTSIDDDGISSRWDVGDRLALWAIDEQGNRAVEAAPFALYHYNATFNTARFRADIDPMPATQYTYYAVVPQPKSVNDLTAAVEIPAVQDGSNHLAGDVMVATPIVASELHEGDNSDEVQLDFNHKAHVLKIYIPENKMGEPVTALQLTFPVEVVGDLEVDVTKPKAAPTLKNGSNVLTLQFPEAKDAGETVYAVIAPVVMRSTDRIKLVAMNADHESKASQMFGKRFAEGHTTPISYTIPAINRSTRVRFSLDGDGTATLGQAIESFTVAFAGGEEIKTFEVNEKNLYELVYEGEFEDNLSNKDIVVTFNSADATVSRRFTLPQIVADSRTDVAPFTIPYLFEEDFEQVTGYTNPAESGQTWGTTSAARLTQYGLTDWSGVQTAVGSGTNASGATNKSMRITCRTEDFWVSVNQYHGRLDSAPLSAIRAGHSVKVRVTLDYDSSASRSEVKPTAAYGYTTTQGVINGQNNRNAVWYISGATTFSVTETNGSFGNLRHSLTYTLNGITSSHRLSWEVNATGRKSASNSDSRVFIDNIKVSIAQ